MSNFSKISNDFGVVVHFGTSFENVAACGDRIDQILTKTRLPKALDETQPQITEICPPTILTKSKALKVTKTTLAKTSKPQKFENQKK